MPLGSAPTRRSQGPAPRSLSVAILGVVVLIALLCCAHAYAHEHDGSCPHAHSEGGCPHAHSEGGCPHAHAHAHDHAHGKGSCPHAHDNDHDHDHEHHHHDHRHDHDHDHDHEHDHHHHHHHHDHDGVADWVAELENTKTGEVREVRTVLHRDGLHYLTPFNLRSALVHSVVVPDAPTQPRQAPSDESSDGNASSASDTNATAATRTHFVAGRSSILLLLYTPSSQLCVDAHPRWAALAKTVRRVVNTTAPDHATAIMTAAFRVDSYADQDEIDAGGPPTGGDGVAVLRENGGSALLEDLPAVVVFVPNATAKTGATMHRWTGAVDVPTVLERLAPPAVIDAVAAGGIRELVQEDELAAAEVGTFTDGVIDV